MSLDKALRFVFAREGGFVNDSADRGGATNMGVTQSVYDRYRIALGILTPLSVEFMRPDEAATIYKDRYWTPAQCFRMFEPLDLVHMDSTVQHGQGNSSRMLQQALGVAVDGRVGLNTIAALIKADAKSLMQDYLHYRDLFYDEIIANDPSQVRFRNGWENRMLALRAEVDTYYQEQ